MTFIKKWCENLSLLNWFLIKSNQILMEFLVEMLHANGFWNCPFPPQLMFRGPFVTGNGFDSLHLMTWSLKTPRAKWAVFSRLLLSSGICFVMWSQGKSANVNIIPYTKGTTRLDIILCLLVLKWSAPFYFPTLHRAVYLWIWKPPLSGSPQASWRCASHQRVCPAVRAE